MLFGGYGLHYEVWLCYLVSMVFIMRYGCVILGIRLGHLAGMSSLWFMVVSFGGMVVLFMGHDVYFGVWSVVVLFGVMVMLFWVISVARPSL